MGAGAGDGIGAGAESFARFISCDQPNVPVSYTMFHQVLPEIVLDESIPVPFVPAGAPPTTIHEENKGSERALWGDCATTRSPIRNLSDGAAGDGNIR